MDVLIVDDQLRARRSLRALLATWSPVKGVREAVNGREALELVKAAPPDLVIMDARMPEMDGLTATREIKARWPQVRVVVLSIYSEYSEEALAAGADAFVTKGEPPQQLLITLASVTGSGVVSNLNAEGVA
jgi:DNA-binding NarL/FixJ family response regulator